jgi:hypothetical protein
LAVLLEILRFLLEQQQQMEEGAWRDEVGLARKGESGGEDILKEESEEDAEEGEEEEADEEDEAHPVGIAVGNRPKNW